MPDHSLDEANALQSPSDLRSPPSRPLARLGRVTVSSVALATACALLVLVLELALLREAEQSGLLAVVVTAMAIQLGFYLLAAGVFLVWFYRAYGVARLLGGRLSYGRLWAVIGWLLPIANFIVPKHLTDDYWRAPDPSKDAHGPESRVPALIHWWWAAWVVASVLGTISAVAFDDLEDGTGLNDALLIDISAQALYVISGVLCVLVVRALTRRLDDAQDPS